MCYSVPWVQWCDMKQRCGEIPVMHCLWLIAFKKWQQQQYNNRQNLIY